MEEVGRRKSELKQVMGVGPLTDEWRGAIPLPLSAEAMRDAGEALDIPTLVGPDGRPLTEQSAQVIVAATSMRDVLREVAKTPTDLRRMDPGQFEALVAHLLDRDGYQVKLQPKSGRSNPDHGFDIFAIQKSGVGRFLFGVQCKRYSESNVVSGEVIRSLRGALGVHNELHGGSLVRLALVTTSSFAPQAMSYAEEYEARYLEGKVEFELDLVDYEDLVRWIGSYA